MCISSIKTSCFAILATNLPHRQCQMPELAKYFSDFPLFSPTCPKYRGTWQQCYQHLAYPKSPPHPATSYPVLYPLLQIQHPSQSLFNTSSPTQWSVAQTGLMTKMLNSPGVGFTPPKTQFWRIQWSVINFGRRQPNTSTKTRQDKNALPIASKIGQ